MAHGPDQEDRSSTSCRSNAGTLPAGGQVLEMVETNIISIRTWSHVNEPRFWQFRGTHASAARWKP